MDKKIIEEGKELLSKMKMLDREDDDSTLTLNGIWRDLKRFLEKIKKLENENTE